MHHHATRESTRRNRNDNHHWGQTRRGLGLLGTLGGHGLLAMGFTALIATAGQADAAGCCITNVCLDLSSGDCVAMGGLELAAGSECSRTECVSVPFMISPAPGSTDISLPQFDDQGGSLSLEGVTMRARGSIIAEAQLTNLSTQLSITEGGATYAGSMTFDLPFFGTQAFQADGFLLCTETLGPGQSCDLGPTLIPDVPISTTMQADAALDDLSGFLGAGSVTATADAGGSFQLSFGTPASFSAGQFATGSIQIAYEFQELDSCDADVDGNGVVDVQDLIATLLNWGCLTTITDECEGDVNKDNTINVLDVTDLILAWGACGS